MAIRPPCHCEPVRTLVWQSVTPKNHRATMGIPKGEAAETLVVDNLVRFLLGPPEESEEHAEVPRRLFAYFLVGEKVGPRRDNITGILSAGTIPSEVTIPPSRLTPCHLPLHKGGFWGNGLPHQCTHWFAMTWRTDCHVASLLAMTEQKRYRVRAIHCRLPPGAVTRKTSGASRGCWKNA